MTDKMQMTDKLETDKMQMTDKLETDKMQMTDKLETDIDKIEDLENKFKQLDAKMDRILELLERDCKKMSDHIDFVDSIYEKVKTPFYYLMNRVNLVLNHSEEKYLDCAEN